MNNPISPSNGIARFIPGLALFKGMKPALLRTEFVVAITVFAVLVSSAMAYGDLAGVTPVAGLYVALGNAPNAKIVVTQSEALLAMYYDDGTVYANGIKISYRGSSTTWTAAAGNDAATVRLVESPGAIVAGATINDIVISWKRRSMYVGRFVGGDEKWQFNLLSPYVGCLGIEAWCATPAGIIFIGEAGVFLFDGSVPRNIDQGIRKLLRRQLNSGNSYGANTAISHDDVNSTVYIWMPDAEGAGDDLVFAYNYVDDRWSVAYSGGVLGAGASYTGFESIIRDYTPLDHVALAGTDDASAQIGHFIVSDEHKVTNLNNSADTTTTAMNTSMVTGRVLGQGEPDGRFTLKRVIPVFDSAIPSALSLSVAGYQYPGFCTSAESTTTASLNSMARFDLMANANNFALTISGTNKNYAIRDLALQVEPAGKKWLVAIRNCLS